MTDSQKLDLVLQKIGDLNQKVDRLDQRVDGLEKKVDRLDQRVDSLEKKVDHLDRDVKVIQLHLENTTDKNIRIMAEGHIDLSRKLDDALRIENEKELLLIRLNYLEMEIRQVKERLTCLEQSA